MTPGTRSIEEIRMACSEIIVAAIASDREMQFPDGILPGAIDELSSLRQKVARMEELVKDWRERGEDYDNYIPPDETTRLRWNDRQVELDVCADELEAALSSEKDAVEQETPNAC